MSDTQKKTAERNAPLSSNDTTNRADIILHSIECQSFKENAYIDSISSIAQLIQDVNGLVQISEKTFSEQIDDVITGKAKPYNAVKLCDTPQILLDVGCAQLPMLYSQKHLKDAIAQKTESNAHLHGLTVDQLKDVPTLMQAPAMIFDSISPNPKGKKSIVVVLDAVDNDNAPIIVSICPNGKGVHQGKSADANFITSIYGKDNDFENYIIRALKSNSMLYIDKKKPTLVIVSRTPIAQGI